MMVAFSTKMLQACLLTAFYVNESSFSTYYLAVYP
jgi:hypothetical protein